MDTSKTTIGSHAFNSATSDDGLNSDDTFQSFDDSYATGGQSPSLPVYWTLTPTTVTPTYHFASTSATPANLPSDSVMPAFVGPNTINVAAAAPGHASFTLNFVTNDQTQAQENLIVSAVTILSSAIKENINIVDNINFTGTGGGANAGPSASYYYSYATVKAALLANEPNDPNLASLPTTEPDPSNNNNQMILVAPAEVKALGLTAPGASPTDDGVATFATDIADDALVGVALHELTHALGRSPWGPPDETDDAPDIFDLYRYTAPGTIYVDDATPSATNPVQQAYFSLDGGKTSLAQYGTTSDPSDYLNGGTNTAGTSYANDPFNEIYTPGSTVQGLTQLDLTQLDVLGFNTSGATATACYVRGTLIRTNRGDVPVERLRLGDRVVTASGRLRPIIWLGHRRLDPTRHPDPANAHPVRVSAGAFGQGLPYRDLWLSPGHSVAFGGALIPIAHIVNGRSVVQVEQDSVEYWHVELDAHDVIFAEGLLAESYLDCGNRTAFMNGGAFIDAHPDFRAKHWADTCLPLALEGEPVAAAKACLLAQLRELGHMVVSEPNAHILVDGRRFEPIQRSATRLAFKLPAGGRDILLCSDVFVPAHTRVDLADKRELGLCIARLHIDGEELAIDQDETCRFGWYPGEFDHGFQRRWTRGAAALPGGARDVIIELGGDGAYWSDPEDDFLSMRLVVTDAA